MVISDWCLLSDLIPAFSFTIVIVLDFLHWKIAISFLRGDADPSDWDNVTDLCGGLCSDDLSDLGLCVPLVILTLWLLMRRTVGLHNKTNIWIKIPIEYMWFILMHWHGPLFTFIYVMSV